MVSPWSRRDFFYIENIEENAVDFPVLHESWKAFAAWPESTELDQFAGVVLAGPTDAGVFEDDCSDAIFETLGQLGLVLGQFQSGVFFKGSSKFWSAERGDAICLHPLERMSKSL